MTYHDYLTHLQSLTCLLMPAQTQDKAGKPLPTRIWWPRLCAKAGVSELVVGVDYGEALTWQELVLVHGKLLEYAQGQFEDRVAEMPENDGRAILASPIPEEALRKTPLTPREQIAAAHVHAKLQQFEGEEIPA